MQLKTQLNKRNGINARALVVFVFEFVIVNVFVVLIGFRVGFVVLIGVVITFVVLVGVVITFVVLVGIVITLVVLIGGGLGLGLMFANENIAVAGCMRESTSFI
jgi:hypothetical protein